jgi:exopolyphosphatase/guanosine-5'-triphosphate,3'-diphosphate pyrophosphatase
MFSAVVRLGAGLTDDGSIGPEATKRALAALRRMGQRLQGVPVANRRALGTNTLRQLHDGGAFLAQASSALGHEIETISGVEEARLIYLAVSHAVPGDAVRLVIDIGGGSTEVICGSGETPAVAESLFMGCISMTERFFGDGELGDKRLSRAILHVRSEVEAIQEAVASTGWRLAIGCSGSIRSITAMMAPDDWGEQRVTAAGLRRLVKEVGKAQRVEQLNLDPVRPDRRAVFPGGLAILAGLFESLQIEALSLSDWSLREGALFDLVGRREGRDIRYQTVEKLIERYHVDTQYARRVRDTALRLFAGVSEPWNLHPDNDRNLLAWAALLHDLGRDIAHSQFHKHGAYVVANADLPGFSRHEQKLLAALVRVHRRKFALEVFDELPVTRRETAKRLAVLLRIAVLLHRGRHSWQLPACDIQVRGSEITLKFPVGWLDDHPLTQADLEAEQAYVEAAGFLLRCK